MRAKTKKTKPDSSIVKTVGVPLEQEDVDAIDAHRAKMGRETLDTPSHGRAARALMRAGARALGYTVAT